MRQLFTFVITTLFTTTVFAQQMDFWHNLSYKGGNHIWLNYDNDYFVSTDRYYSQGIAVAGKFQVGKKSFLNRTLLDLPHSVKTVGFGLEHMAFTPRFIGRGPERPFDHPYAAQFQGYAIFETVDTVRGNMIGYRLGGGIIGPQTKGMEIQIGIHNALGGMRPVGWENQVQSGLLLDAGFYARQRIFGFGRWFKTVVEEQLNLGTGRDDFSIGTKFHAEISTRDNKWLFGLYFVPSLKVVGYDATLQGSLINFAGSPVTIPSEDINRLIFSREFGAMAKAGKFTITYMVHIDTPQFNNQMYPRWGGIRIGWNF